MPFVWAKHKGCKSNVGIWLLVYLTVKHAGGLGKRTKPRPLDLTCKIKWANVLFLKLIELYDSSAGKKSPSLSTINKRTKCLYTWEWGKFAVSWAECEVTLSMEILKNSFTILPAQGNLNESLWEQQEWFKRSKLQRIRAKLPFPARADSGVARSCPRSPCQPWVLLCSFHREWSVLSVNVRPKGGPVRTATEHYIALRAVPDLQFKSAYKYDQLLRLWLWFFREFMVERNSLISTWRFLCMI